MKNNIFTDEELIIIYNRSQKRFSEYKDNIYKIRTDEIERMNTPIVLRNGSGYCATYRSPKDDNENHFDISSIDDTTLKWALSRGVCKWYNL